MGDVDCAYDSHHTAREGLSSELLDHLFRAVGGTRSNFEMTIDELPAVSTVGCGS